MALKYKLNRKCIKEKMASLGFTQTFVAELLGMSRQNFSQMMLGQQGTTDKNITKLAKLLGLTVNDIIVL